MSALHGIANAGYNDAFDIALTYLDEKYDESVRAAAIESIRLMEKREVDSFIAKTMKDKSLKVRIAAVNAAKTRNPSNTLCSALALVAESSKESILRKAALKIIIRWYAEWPQFKSTLEAMAKSDDNAGLRNIASAALTAEE